MKSNDVQSPPKRSAPRTSSAFQGLQLFLVQSSVCVLALLIVWLLRWIGADAFEDIAFRFREAMLDDTLVTAVVRSFESEPVSVQAASGLSIDQRMVIAPLTGGVITSEFGEREHPISDQTALHEGIDIAAAGGTPLCALMNGEVTTVCFDENGYGNYVVVTCSKTEKYLYAHCSSITVEQGDAVAAGDIIAYVGSTGRSTGDHLHFEWIVNEVPVDPIVILPETTYA